MGTAPRYRESEAIPVLASHHLIDDTDITANEVLALFRLATKIKARPNNYSRVLAGKTVLWFNEKDSYRTDVTVSLAAQQMHAIHHKHGGKFDERESVEDMAGPLAGPDGWGVDFVVARTYDHEYLRRIAKIAPHVHVINGLTDYCHPLQALADMFTLYQVFSGLHGIKLAFVGDGNNVAHSLMLSCAKLGVNFCIATPKGYEPNATVLQMATNLAKQKGSLMKHTNDPQEAAAEADAIYTDAICSMGQESQKAERAPAFRDYQVCPALLARTGKADTKIMHCAPVHWGQEISEDLNQSQRSLIVGQAKNRLHTLKALLMMMVAKDD